MPFSRVLVRSKTASIRIWTRIGNSISHDDNRYAKYAFYIKVLTENNDNVETFQKYHKNKKNKND